MRFYLKTLKTNIDLELLSKLSKNQKLKIK